MILFCGYLMALTKITGMVYYAVFLIAVTGYNVLFERRRGISIWKAIIGELTVRRVLQWMIPGFIYLFLMVSNKAFKILYMQGEYIQPMQLRPLKEAFLTFLQLNGMGLRWVIWIAAAASCVYILVRKKGKRIPVTEDGKCLCVGIIVSTAIFSGVLLVYNATGALARYTAQMNLFYCFLLAASVLSVFPCVRKQITAGIITGGILLAQTYVIFDPLIMKRDGMETGNGKKIYNLSNEISIDGKYRIYSEPLYVYNYSSGFYDGLISEMLKDIQPTEKDQFYILDLNEYEFQLHGMQYKMYWSPEKQRMVYSPGEGRVYLKAERLQTEDISQMDFPEDFYVVIASRVDDAAANACLTDYGYRSDCSIYSNLYGEMKASHYSK